MKNFLIPTTLQQDTVCSVKTAINQAAGTKCVITLMLLNDVRDAAAHSYFKTNTKQLTTPAQMLVLDECRTAIGNSLNCLLNIHNQCGITAPILKNLLGYLAIDVIIIPASYRQEGKKIHNSFLELLSNTKIPILHLTADCEMHELNKALFVKRDGTAVSLTEIKQVVNNRFTFKVVGHALISDYPEEPDVAITKSISEDDIDLLIETRKNCRMRNKKNAVVNKFPKLPVLSINEEAVKG